MPALPLVTRRIEELFDTMQHFNDGVDACAGNPILIRLLDQTRVFARSKRHRSKRPRSGDVPTPKSHVAHAEAETMRARRTIRIATALATIAALVAPGLVSALDGTELVSTVAGGNLQGSNSDQLNDARGVVVGTDGAIYVADTGNHRVQKIATSGTITTVAGGNGQGSNNDQLNAPFGLAISDDDTLYISDTNNHRIQMIAPNGATTTILGGNGSGSAADKLNQPHGLALDAADSLYIVDQVNNRVQKRTSSGTVTTVAGGSGVNQLTQPRAVAVADDGTIYVADTHVSRIQKIETNGDVTTVAGSGGLGSGEHQLHYPYGVLVDDDGTLYVSDTDNHRVQRIDANGDVTTIAGGHGNGVDADQFSYQMGIFLDEYGSLYVADLYNDRVQKFTAADSTDTTDPTVVISSPTPNSDLEIGSSHFISFSCDDYGISGLETCLATLDGSTITSGSAIETSEAGEHSLIVTATDGAANSHIETVTFSISDTTEPHSEPVDRKLTGDYESANGSRGSIARLYMLVFNRQPDGSGYAYWLDRTSSGLTQTEMADFFVTSPEFTAIYDTLDNPGFVELLYRNVMSRDGDAAGVTFWNQQLDGGASRALVALLFSESPEFKRLTGSS